MPLSGRMQGSERQVNRTEVHFWLHDSASSGYMGISGAFIDFVGGTACETELVGSTCVLTLRWHGFSFPFCHIFVRSVSAFCLMVMMRDDLSALCLNGVPDESINTPN